MNLRSRLKESSIENSDIHSESTDLDLLDTKKKVLKKIDVDKIDFNPYQPRKKINHESIIELSESIKEHGLIQPITIRRINNKYQLIAGERRLRATKELNEKTIYCVIDDISDKESARQSLIENIERENLSDLEIGMALRKMEPEFNSVDELAKSIGIARTNIYKYWAYESFPNNCLDILLKNPPALSRKFAVEIKTILNAIKNKKEKQKVEEELSTMLEELIIDNINALTIVKKLSSFKGKPGKEKISKNESIIRDGKKIGRFFKQGHTLTISINTKNIPTDIEDDILQFIKKNTEK